MYGNFILRPSAYKYATNLRQHIEQQRGPAFKPFDGNLALPKQIEIHLSNSWGQRCNVSCGHCQGRKLSTKISPPLDDKIISLIRNLNGSIPRFVFSGLYSEPTMNYRLIDIIEAVKSTGSTFGLHTNGILLKPLETSPSSIKNEVGFLTRLHAASDGRDYLSVSLDACSPTSYAITKGLKSKNSGLLFKGVLEGLDIFGKIKNDNSKETLAIQITYLLNDSNSSSERDLEIFMKIMRFLSVDSIRFSVPYAPFASSLPECNTYHAGQIESFRRYLKFIFPYLSRSSDDKPFIFVIPPEKQDLKMFNFSHCFSGYDAITLGADGFFYRCCSSAHPMFGHLKLGQLTDNIDEFKAMVLNNQQECFNPDKACFPKGARCTRAAFDINNEFESEYFPKS